VTSLDQVDVGAITRGVLRTGPQETQPHG
jgi:hypothetical protein